MADWYYIGHYGQLGPLYREQVDDLISGGVITGETYVWKVGMPNWMPANQVMELQGIISSMMSSMPPPPPSPGPASRPQQSVPYGPSAGSPGPAPYSNPISGQSPIGTPPYYSAPLAPVAFGSYLGSQDIPKSDRSRIAAGLLNIFLPGIGRIYLGYSAYGVLQLVVSICTFGIGTIWPFIDGILMLAGTPKLDGFGRRLDN